MRGARLEVMMHRRLEIPSHVGALATCWLTLLALACDHGRVASESSAIPCAPNQSEFAATLTRDDDSWIVHYRFSEPQSALLFDTAHGDYRATHWTPLDPGTELVNIDGLDGLFFDPPVHEARLRIRPPTKQFEGTRPFLRFSDQSLAFYSGQLALLTVESREAAEALRGDLSRWHGRQPPVLVTFEADGPIVADRKGTPDCVTVTAHLGAGPYLYPGPIPVVRTDASLMVLDPGLPEWLRARVPEDLAAVDAALEKRWQSDIPDAVNLLAWGGPGDDTQNIGRAEGFQIAMSITGSRYLQPDPENLAALVWFFAHERAHHFQLNDGIHIEEWPLEGAADTMATVILADLGLLDERGLQRRYARVQHECARELARGPLDSQRGTHACGDLLSLGTLHLLPSHDLFGFWRELLAAARAQGARIDTSFYLYVLGRAGIDESALTAIQQFVTESHADPNAATIDLLEGFGLNPVYDREAGLQSLDIVLPPG
jgi:hypothetical protein